MNHYPHHIGDFNNGTRHLTRIERSIYRDLIELYYDTEAPLNGDVDALARRIIARSEEEKTALVAVLGEFFKLQDGVYRHSRCDDEIAAYQSRVETAKANGQRGGRRPKTKSVNSANPEETKSVFFANPEETKPLANQNQNQNQYIPPTPKGDEVKVRKAKAPEQMSEDFLTFWNTYPRKTGKGAAWKAWNNANRPPLEVILSAIRKARQSPDWLKDRGAFIPHPSTWLNQARWEDEGMDYAALAGKRDLVGPSSTPQSGIDEADAFRWRRETYPESLEVHPTASTFPYAKWPDSIKSEYRASKKPQLQAA